MLRKEIDYVPLSPKKKSTLSRAELGNSRQTAARSISKLQRLESGSEDDCRMLGHPTPGGGSEPQKDRIRTTEEKKELLGTMLGNVDALVEGVRKAGIWGLG